MTRHSTPAQSSSCGPRSAFLGLAPMMAVAFLAGSVGCYRSTGQPRPTTVAQQIPATGGDRVGGVKATAGPGDYYLGNDHVQLAVDGAAFGKIGGQFGAPSGGAILDIGGVALDTAFNRVSTPTDNLESLAPVVNQDPDLRLVFDRYSTTNTTDLVTLTMQGYLLDSLHKLAGATWTPDGRVQGVTVVHTISLGPLDNYFTLNTKITNNSGAALPILNLGDFLLQRGGGFRFVIPATQDASGNPIFTWGMDIPGSNFSSPLTTSVRAKMVALEGAEPSADDMDSHQTLGLLPLGADQLFVASDPQNTLSESRPIFPSRLVVGSVPLIASLPTNGSLSYSRRLYALSGPSLSAGGPAKSDGLFNEMEGARQSLTGISDGWVLYSTAGTAAFKGYRQTEIRFERYIADTTVFNPATDTNDSHWMLERLSFPEAGENPGAPSSSSVLLPAYPDPALSGAFLPYRVIIKNKDTQTRYETIPQVQSGAITNADLLRPTPAGARQIAYSLSAEMGQYLSQNGSPISPIVGRMSFTLRRGDGTNPPFAVQPARFTFQGLDSTGAADPSKDPVSRRNRFLAGLFNPILKIKSIIGNSPGNYVFSEGNQFFGSTFLPGHYSSPFTFPLGNYRTLVSQGPLNPLTINQFTVSPVFQENEIPYLFRPAPAVPGGWSSFDVPGPSQRTTGGMMAAEQLSSALAEGVDVVGRTEIDEFTDGKALHDSFHSEFTTSGDAAIDAARTSLIGGHPYVVNGRTSNLAEGTFTTLFAPTPASSLPFGGALPSTGWSAADFLGQGGGNFVIANRPRGPQGLFTAHPVTAGVPLGTGANSWWDNTDALANGKRTGDFNAIELLRGEGCDPADPSAWFSEFKTVRTDWFNLLNLETPTQFTKALGLSSGVYSLDTPVGLARTYLKLGSNPSQGDLSPVSTALNTGAAVASTGPLLDVAIGTTGPGGFVPGTNPLVTLTVNVWAATWVPIDEVRVVVNGGVAVTTPFGSNPAANGWTADPLDARHWSMTFVNMPMSTLTAGKDGWVVVEAGVPLSTSGAYAVGTPWNKVMKGIYPVAVTNPIFVDVDGGGYTAPL